MLEFFSAVFKHAPLQGVIRWGPLRPDCYITVEELEVVQPVPSDLFFGPAIRSSRNPTKEAVLGAGVAWLDYDEGVPLSLLPPSIVVASGGPGKFHFYWLLDRFVEPKILEACNKAVAAHQRVPGGTWERTRILRVPGTVNTKYKPARDVRIVAFHPDRIYSPDVVSSLQAFDPELLRVTKSRSERDWKVTRLLLSWGIPEDVTRQSLLILSDKAKEDPGYAERTVEKARQQKPAARATQTKALANFGITPLSRLVGPGGEDEGLLLEVFWDTGQTRMLAIQKDLESRRAVNSMVDRNGLKSRSWTGSDKTIAEMWMTLVEQCPDKTTLLVRQAGRYDHPSGGATFVYGKEDALGVASSVFWAPVADALQPLEIFPGEYNREALVSAILQLNKPEVVQPMLGWTMATAFKPLFEDLGARFPVLLAFGLRGSGKTSMLRLLLPLVGQVTSPVGADVTRFALLAALSSSRSVPVWIGEFRMSLPNAGDLQMLLRLNYDGGAEERGRPDLSVTRFDLGAPVAIDGEALFSDSAMRERTLSVRLSQTDVLTGTEFYDAHQRMLALQDQAPHFAFDYLDWALTIDRQRVASWMDRGNEEFRDLLPYSRLCNAASIAYAGLLALDEFCPGVLTPSADAIYQSMLNSFAPGLGVITPVERLVELLTHLYKQGQAWATASAVWDDDEKVLWVNLTSVLHWVRRFWHEMPDRDMLIPQVRERIGVYLREPKIIEGGTYYGIDIRQAQALGLDCPIPRTETFEVF